MESERVCPASEMASSLTGLWSSLPSFLLFHSQDFRVCLSRPTLSPPICPQSTDVSFSFPSQTVLIQAIDDFLVEKSRRTQSVQLFYLTLFPSFDLLSFFVALFSVLFSFKSFVLGCSFSI